MPNLAIMFLVPSMIHSTVGTPLCARRMAGSGSLKKSGMACVWTSIFPVIILGQGRDICVEYQALRSVSANGCLISLCWKSDARECHSLCPRAIYIQLRFARFSVAQRSLVWRPIPPDSEDGKSLDDIRDTS